MLCYTVLRGVDPYRTGGHVPPNIYEGGTSMEMSPNISEVMSFRMSTRVTTTFVCCILTQILCVVSQKSFSFWGTSSVRPPTGAPPLDGAWFPRLPVFFYVPPIILWDWRPSPYSLKSSTVSCVELRPVALSYEPGSILHASCCGYLGRA